MKAIQPSNRPVRVDRGAYHTAIQSYLARVTNVAGVRSVYTMGSIKAPGLSDIDMIVVVDDDFNSNNSHQLVTSGIDERLFLHGPVVLPVAMISVLQYLIYASGLDRLYGHDELPEFAELNAEVANTLRMAYAIDFLESRQVQYDRVLKSRRIDQRAWMTRLWSMTHSEKLLTDVGIEISDTDSQVLSRIKDLRRRWTESYQIDDKEFVEVFLLSMQTSRSLWLAALNYSYKRTGGRTGVLRFRADNKFFEFREDIEYCEAGFRTLRIPRYPVTILRIMANPIYAAHLAMYGYVDSGLVPTTTVLDHNCLAARARYVRLHHGWIAKHCARAGSMSGYTGISTASVGVVRRSVSSLSGLFGRYELIRR